LKFSHPDLRHNFKKTFLFFCLISIYNTVLAQDKGSPIVRGIIISQEQKVLGGAAVFLLKAVDSSVVKVEVSDKIGAFTFHNVKADQYYLKLTYIGYRDILYGPYLLQNDTPDLDVGKLQLNVLLKNLKEVEIVEKKNVIERRPGKIILNVGSSILSAGNSAYDILKASPGVQMDAVDNIKLNGKGHVLITINGKQTFMEQEALMDLLKSTLSDEIDQIELISNPSSKFDAGSSGSIINIKLKKNKNFGINGSVSAMAGLSNPQAVKDPNTRYNSGLNLNFRNRALNLFGSYNYADNNQTGNIMIGREINNSRHTAINVDYLGQTHRAADTYRLGMDVNLRPNHVLGFMFNGSNNQIGINKNNRSAILNDGVLDSTIHTDSEQNRALNNSIFNVNYKGRLGKKAGQLSIDWDYINYDRSSREMLTNGFLDADNNSYRESLILRNSSPAQYNIHSVKIDYALSFNKTSKFEAGLQGSKVKGDSHLDFGRMIGPDFYPDMQFVNHFLIEEQIGAAYMNYDLNRKKSSLALGMRAEITGSKGTSLTSGEVNKRNYLNFFPNLQYSYSLNKEHNLLLSYSRRITRPGYDNLNPFVAYLDQYSFRSGNPLLKPEFSQIAEITHVFKSKFTTTLRATMATDVIMEVNEQDDASQINNAISRNIDRQYQYGVDINAPLQLATWWNADLNLQSFYEKFVAKTATGSNFQNTSPSLIFSALQTFTFNDSFSAELNGKYESPTIYGIYNYESAYSVDAAFAKSLLKKNAILRLRVSDLFNTSSNHYSSHFQNLNLHVVERRDSRTAQLSFSYQFGRRSVKPARKRNTGSETEQGRIGS
jgi:outer membrane receptor protein involved in Fe transport